MKTLIPILQIVTAAILFHVFSFRWSLTFEPRMIEGQQAPREMADIQFISTVCKGDDTTMLATFDTFPNSRMLMYHKCGIVPFPEAKVWNITHKTLENVGREGHTWLHFMLHEFQNYPAKHYVFLQGELEVIVPWKLKEFIDTTGDSVITSLGFCLQMHPQYFEHATGEEEGELTPGELCKLVEELSGKPCWTTAMFRTGQLLASRESIIKLLENKKPLLERFYHVLSLRNAPKFGMQLEVMWGTLFASANNVPHEHPYIRCNLVLRNFGGQRLAFPNA